MVLNACVHALSEYTPKFGDVEIEPVEVKVEDAVRAEKVASVKASPIIINAVATVAILSFKLWVFIFFSLPEFLEPVIGCFCFMVF